MKVSNFVVAMVVGLLTLVLAPDSLSQASQKKAVEMNQSKEAKSIYSCPMHSEVTSDKPGKCPKCGMALVLSKGSAFHDGNVTQNSTVNDKIDQAKSLLIEAKKELAPNGEYNCCIKDPCDRCALDHQSCPCADDVKSL